MLTRRLTDWKCPDKVMMGNMFAAMVKKYGAEPPYLEDTGDDDDGRAEGQEALGDGSEGPKEGKEDAGDDETEEQKEDSKGEGEQAN